MAIQRIDRNLPMTERIDQLNDQTLDLSGKTEQASFDKHEVENLYSGSGLQQQYVRSFSFSSNTGAGAWFNWNHLRAESGYSIWKFVTGSGQYSYAPNTINQLYFDDNIMAYKGTATAEDITDFDSVFTYDGLTFTDNTAEAATEAGDPFSSLVDTGDFVYIGSDERYTGIRFLFDSRGSNYLLKFEYSNSGAGWSELLSTEHGLLDGTSNFRRDAAITFDDPGTDWVNTTSVDGSTRYWVRISTTQNPITPATIFAALPYDSVPALLALSSKNIKDEAWAFCDLNNIIYATFRNTGDPDFEGNRHVSSSSSVANQQNFFRFNHTVKGDFENVNYNYTGSGISVMRSDGQAPLKLIEAAGGSAMDITATAAAAKTGAGVFIPITFNGVTYHLQLFN